MGLTIDEINAKIKSLNEVVRQKNEERQLLLGKKQTLEAQLSSLKEEYKALTGVDLNTVSIDDEVNRVVAEKTAEITKLETVIQLIDSGNFAEAQKYIDGEQGETEVVSNETEVVPTETEPVKEEVTQPVANPLAEFNTPAEPKVEAPKVEEPKVEAPVVSEPVVAPPSSDVVAPPKSDVVTPPKSDVVAPPSSEPSKPAAPINSFSAILGGTSFLPN